MGYSQLGSSVHRIHQARIVEQGSHSILQGIFPTQGSNPGLLHCREILYRLSLPSVTKSKLTLLAAHRPMNPTDKGLRQGKDFIQGAEKMVG